MRWFEKYPERLEYELRALEEAGFKPEIDEAERAAGRLVLAIKYRIGEAEHPLRVIFPADYPYFAFQVFAPSLSLTHHQDPYSKLLCFVADIESEWRTSDTVAKYLIEQLPKILAANEDRTTVREAREGAPATGYMAFAPNSVVMTGDWTLPPDQKRGTFLIGIEPGSNSNEVLRGAVLEVRDAEGRLLGEIDDRLKTFYKERVEGRWVRLPARPKSGDATAILAEALPNWPELRTPQFSGGPDVAGIIFPDEARYRELHDLWVFVVRRRDRMLPVHKGKRRPPGDQISIYLARPDRGSRSDLQARVSRLAALATKKIAIFGLGALGSMVAWQFGRAGIGQLVLIDHDTVQAGNMPRWLMGWSAAGLYKTHALAAYFRHHYPLVAVTPIVYRLGAADVALNLVEQIMAKSLDNTDLVIDCTVEFTVHHYLSSVAWERGIPYIWASGTPGSWGGIVGRAIRGKTQGCWKCFQGHRTDGIYPSPAQEEGPDIQPVGCFSPTFTGTGFDLDLVSLMAVRLATATLCSGINGGYPDFDWDIGIVDLWKDGRPIAPQWTTFTLTRHEGCDAHG